MRLRIPITPNRFAPATAERAGGTVATMGSGMMLVTGMAPRGRCRCPDCFTPERLSGNPAIHLVNIYGVLEIKMHNRSAWGVVQKLVIGPGEN